MKAFVGKSSNNSEFISSLKAFTVCWVSMKKQFFSIEAENSRPAVVATDETICRLAIIVSWNPKTTYNRVKGFLGCYLAEDQYNFVWQPKALSSKDWLVHRKEGGTLCPMVPRDSNCIWRQWIPECFDIVTDNKLRTNRLAYCLVPARSFQREKGQILPAKTMRRRLMDQHPVTVFFCL